MSRDQLSQNETPIAVNPANPSNMITGANDWNYNDGCAVNATFDGGTTWTPTLPNGFLPGVTKYTNDPDVAGDRRLRRRRRPDDRVRPGRQGRVLRVPGVRLHARRSTSRCC